MHKGLSFYDGYKLLQPSEGIRYRVSKAHLHVGVLEVIFEL
jgi:hypothetical protein